ncbi:MAG: hypothetical protein Tsb0013_20950 [Phycisphaerales bacterium]
MAPFMVDGEGFGALQDIFYSASDLQGKRDRDSLNQQVNDNGGDWDGVLGGVNDIDDSEEKNTSFRYATAFMVDFQTQRGSSSVTPNLFQFFNTIGEAGSDQNTFYQYIRETPNASVLYPSQKVMYFMLYSFHNPQNQFYFEPGVQSPICMADGSARVSDVYNEGLQWDFFDQSGCPVTVDIVDGQNAGTEFRPVGMLTDHGVRGRDLQGN